MTVSLIQFVGLYGLLLRAVDVLCVRACVRVCTCTWLPPHSNVWVGACFYAHIYFRVKRVQQPLPILPQSLQVRSSGLLMVFHETVVNDMMTMIWDMTVADSIHGRLFWEQWALPSD